MGSVTLLHAHSVPTPNNYIVFQVGSVMLTATGCGVDTRLAEVETVPTAGGREGAACRYKCYFSSFLAQVLSVV